MNKAIRRTRNDVFLGQRLQPVGRGLEQAKGTDSVWAVTILDPAQAFALQNRGEREQGGEDDDDGGRAQQAGDNGLKLTGRQANQPVLQLYKHLIHHFAIAAQPPFRRHPAGLRIVGGEALPGIAAAASNYITRVQRHSKDFKENV